MSQNVPLYIDTRDGREQVGTADVEPGPGGKGMMASLHVYPRHSWLLDFCSGSDLAHFSIQGGGAQVSKRTNRGIACGFSEDGTYPMPGDGRGFLSGFAPPTPADVPGGIKKVDETWEREVRSFVTEDRPTNPALTVTGYGSVIRWKPDEGWTCNGEPVFFEEGQAPISHDLLGLLDNHWPDGPTDISVEFSTAEPKVIRSAEEFQETYGGYARKQVPAEDFEVPVEDTPVPLGWLDDGEAVELGPTVTTTHRIEWGFWLKAKAKAFFDLLSAIGGEAAAWTDREPTPRWIATGIDEAGNKLAAVGCGFTKRRAERDWKRKVMESDGMEIG